MQRRLSPAAGAPRALVSPSPAARIRTGWLVLLAAGAAAGFAGAQDGDDGRRFPDPPEGFPPPVPVEGATAEGPDSMRPYEEVLPGSDVTFALVPIPGGTFLLGSPEDEEDRGEGEGPQVEVRVSPFWMGVHEVGWEEYQQFQFSLDRQAREKGKGEATEQDRWADAVSRPTPPYVPMDFNMGVKGFPAICMTHFAARQYTKWLSMKTGRFYRLPTEAEWEYACRAGSTTAYSFGDDVDELGKHAWYFDNGLDRYHKLGKKKANAFGLHDMHGNVAEWCLDAYDPDFYGTLEKGALDPLNWPTELYPRVTRGGSWDHDPEDLRSAARMPSKPGWKVQDPQLPKSIWYHTDATFVGLRVVRPLNPPPVEEWARYWEADVPEVREIEARQRRGER